MAYLITFSDRLIVWGRGAAARVGASKHLNLLQGFLTWSVRTPHAKGARNVPRGCGDRKSLKLIRPTFFI